MSSALLFGILLACWADAAPKQRKLKKETLTKAPPPVLVIRESQSPVARSTMLPADKYAIGSPSDEEQLFVEHINRARADAIAESVRLANTTDPDVLSAIASWNVILTEMLSQFTILEQTLPPLSINSILTDVARLHTQDMFDNVFQGHFSSSSPPAPFSSGDSLGNRVDYFPAYNYEFLGENVFSNSKSVFYGHAAFEIDWGSGPYGMQDPPGHRYNIHQYAESPDPPFEFREIGVGVILGSNTAGSSTVGPMLVTQNFGSVFSPVPFITGVAYFDLNSNSFYDLGEGLGGITVEIAEGPAWAETADSGGYSVPVAGNGTYNVTFSGPYMNSSTSPVLIANSDNTKHDLILTYSPPQVFGTANPLISTSNTYKVSPIPGASSYRIRVWQGDSSPWLQGAEDGPGTSEVTITQTPGYDVIQSALTKTGTYAFHMVHPLAQVSTEIIEINETFLPTASSELRFESKLGYASSTQIAYIELSTDEGVSWSVIYSQPGTNSSGESTFSQRSVSLVDYANVPVNIRFRYSIESGVLYIGTETIYGWLIDDIEMTDSSRLSINSDSMVTTNSFDFNPSSSGIYHLSAMPINNSRQFPVGPLTTVSAGTVSTLELWRAGHFSGPDLADPLKEATVWGNQADPDLDGLNNELEFALNGDPNLPDAGSVTPRAAQSGDTLTLEYTKYRNEVTYTVKRSDDLNPPWDSGAVTQSPDPTYSPEGTQIEATTTIGAGGKAFLELDVSLP